MKNANNYLSVLYKHIIQVENKNVGLKVRGGGEEGTNIPLPPNQKSGGTHAPLPLTRFLRQCVVCAALLQGTDISYYSS